MKYTLNLATGAYINRRHLYGLYAGLAFVLVLVLTLNLVNLVRSRARTAEIDARLTELRSRDRATAAAEVNPTETQRLAARIVFANELLIRDAYRWTALFDQLEEHLVSGVSIRGLTPDYKSGELQISGVAASIGDLRRFLDRLAASTVFENVYLKNQSKIKNEEETSEITFSIELKRTTGGAE